MSRFCLPHHEHADANGQCHYCRMLAAGLIGHDPRRTTAYNTDDTRKIKWETLEARKQGLWKKCVVCGDDFQAKRVDQKTCGKPECRAEWHRKISRKAMSALKAERREKRMEVVAV